MKNNFILFCISLCTILGSCKKETINTSPNDEDSLIVSTNNQDSTEQILIDNNENQNTIAPSNSPKRKDIHISSNNEELNNQIRNYLNQKKECQEYDKSIKEMTHGKKGLTFTFLSQGDKIVIKAGYDGEDRFETYETYNYYIRTKKYTKVDIVSGEEIPF
ncbi:MAG: hypothetical protein K6D57_04625 [Paludibacteraceae bacterium]|nr:hypothetical protein [Paludibacteraceae bacterium]